MLCIYRVSGNGNDQAHAVAVAADRFDGVADRERAAAGLEEGEALIDNAVSSPQVYNGLRLLVHGLVKLVA